MNGVDNMKIIEVKNPTCRCDNCNKLSNKTIDMEFSKIHLCNQCSKDLFETLKK